MIPAPTCDICGRADREVVPITFSIARQPVFSARVCKPHADELGGVVKSAYNERVLESHVRRVAGA